MQRKVLSENGTVSLSHFFPPLRNYFIESFFKADCFFPRLHSFTNRRTTCRRRNNGRERSRMDRCRCRKGKLETFSSKISVLRGIQLLFRIMIGYRHFISISSGKVWSRATTEVSEKGRKGEIGRRCQVKLSSFAISRTWSSSLTHAMWFTTVVDGEKTSG